MPITHPFVSAVVDSEDPDLVGPDEWNEDHEGNALVVQAEGTPLATDAATLNFVGAGVTATGAGAEKTITIPGAATPLASGVVHRTNIASNRTTTSTTFVDIDSTNLTIDLTTGARRVMLQLILRWANSGGSAAGHFWFTVDGTLIHGVGAGDNIHYQREIAANAGMGLSLSIPTEVLSAGVHTFRPVFLADAGTLTAYQSAATDHIIFSATELPAGVGGSAGTELDYTEFTSGVSPTATSEATANTVVTAGAVTFDGSTAVIIEFFAPVARPQATANHEMGFYLYDGSSSIGRIGHMRSPTTANCWMPVSLKRRLTPSAASHTYSIRAALAAAGTGSIIAGAGGSGADVPGFIRISVA